MKKENLKICYCGNVETNHNFRHLFEPSKDVKVYKNGGLVFELDATQWKPIEEKGKCGFPQCNRTSALHWNGTDEDHKKVAIFKHIFVPTDPYQYREISFVIPERFPCNVCGIQYTKHGEDHHFTALVYVVNKNEKDLVKISHESQAPIKVRVLLKDSS